MDFNTFEIVQMAIDVLFAIVLVGSLWYCVPKLKSYRQMVQIMTLESRETTTDPELIKGWVRERAKLRKGSKKWIAYTNSLKAEGYEE